MFQNSVVTYCRLALIGFVFFVFQGEAAAIAPPPPDGPPAPILIGVMLSGPDLVTEEETAQYVCTGKYSDGTTAPISADWSLDSTHASIDSSGMLSAENVSADQNVIITATYGSYSASLAVVIKYVAPVLTGITISGPESLDEEDAAQYSCVADWSDGTSTAVDPVWGENSSYTTINSSGLLIAGNVPSDENITVTASYDGQTDTHTVTIKYVAPTVTGLTISGAGSFDEEKSEQYICTADWSDGTSTPVTPVWGENSSYASISPGGLLSAGNVPSDQNVTITASFGSIIDTYSVTINYVAPTLDSIEISGATSLDEETSAQYTCTAKWSDGTSTTVSPSWSEDSLSATINDEGVLSAGDVTANGSLTITASYEGKTDTYGVTIRYVEPPVAVTGISIAGPAELDENTTAQFTCTATYSDGTIAEVAASWSENSSYASFSAGGVLSVGNIESDQPVTITASYGGMTATKTVMITLVGTEVIYPLDGIAGKTVMAELWVLDEATETWIDLDEFTIDSEELVLENMSPGLWYWIQIMEYSTADETWVTVHRNLLSM